MGMPITVEIADKEIGSSAFDATFGYFEYVDNKFSTYKETSEITKINKGLLKKSDYSKDMREVFKLCNDTKRLTNGYFEIKYKKNLDPSGLVKGWSIFSASKLLKNMGYKNFYVDAGGDIQVSGVNANGDHWTVGIQNPFDPKEIIKVLSIYDKGVATSGTYMRGQHVYNPKKINTPIDDILSITVIGPNIYEADRFATAAFAMGEKGINFIENLEGFEGYMVDIHGIATYTARFENYIMTEPSSLIAKNAKYVLGVA